MIEINRKLTPRIGVNGVEIILTISDRFSNDIEDTMLMWGKMPGEVAIRIVSKLSDLLDTAIGTRNSQIELLDEMRSEFEEMVKRIDVLKGALKRAG